MRFSLRGLFIVTTVAALAAYASTYGYLWLIAFFTWLCVVVLEVDPNLWALEGLG
jgi:hypothetical protein